MYLREALESFADPATAAEYKELASLVMPRLPPSDLPPAPSVSSKPLKEDPSTTYPRFLAVQAKASGEILHLLKAGELLAVGYIASDKRRETPQWIAADRWQNGRISLQQSQLWVDDDLFEDVRIVESSERTAAAIAATIAHQPSPRRRGRPSRRDRIIEAYRALRDEGKIDFRALHLNFEPVRKLVMRLPLDQPGEKGLSNEAIRSAISAEFKRDQLAESATEK